MENPGFTLSSEAREVLMQLREEATGGFGTRLPRLTERVVIALTLDEPGKDDVILEENGRWILAVSRHLLDQLTGESQLDITLPRGSEPEFRIVSRKRSLDSPE